MRQQPECAMDESTYKRVAAVKNHLKEFKEDLTFEYFNELWIERISNFLRDTKDMSTIGKPWFLKWFLLELQRKDIIRTLHTIHSNRN